MKFPQCLLKGAVLKQDPCALPTAALCIRIGCCVGWHDVTQNCLRSLILEASKTFENSDWKIDPWSIDLSYESEPLSNLLEYLWTYLSPFYSWDFWSMFGDHLEYQLNQFIQNHTKSFSLPQLFESSLITSRSPTCCTCCCISISTAAAKDQEPAVPQEPKTEVQDFTSSEPKWRFHIFKSSESESYEGLDDEVKIWVFPKIGVPQNGWFNL